MGYLLQWLAVLEDPVLTGLKSELTSGGGLGADSSLALYDYLVGLTPDSVSAYVAASLEAIATHLETMRAPLSEPVGSRPAPRRRGLPRPPSSRLANAVRSAGDGLAQLKTF